MVEHLEHEIDARGAVYVVLALDLLPFVKPASREKMLEIRGRAIFDDYLESLNLSGSCFERDQAYTQLEEQGYELGVFDQILVKDNFAPTYRLHKERVEFPLYLSRNVQFRNRFLPAWNKWDFWFRLTRNGVISIIMKLNVPKRRRLILISRDVIGLQAAFDMDEARNVLAELQEGLAHADSKIKTKMERLQEFIEWVNQHALLETEQNRNPIIWPLVVMVIRQFIAATRGHLYYGAQSGFDIQLTDEIERAAGNPLRERYVIFQFDELTRFNRETRKNELIAPRTILQQPEYAQLVSSLLEGVILEKRSTEKNQAKSYFYPDHSLNTVKHLVDYDCSSWEDEFCIIQQQSAAIYSAFPIEKEKVVFPSRIIHYNEYWQCIRRGFEFLLETKVIAQVAERTTYEKLEEALHLLRGNHDVPKPQELPALSNDIGNVARLMSHLRTISVPQITSRASYAIEKFEFFNRQSGIEKVLAHAEANLRDLTDLIDRHNDLNLQVEAQKTNRAALFIAVIASLSISLGILNFPSFIKDWEEEIGQSGPSFFKQQWYSDLLPIFGEAIVFSMLVLCLGIALYGFFSFVRNRWRKKPYML